MTGWQVLAVAIGLAAWLVFVWFALKFMLAVMVLLFGGHDDD